MAPRGYVWRQRAQVGVSYFMTDRLSLFYRTLCELDFVTGKVFAIGNGRETLSWLRVNLNLKLNSREEQLATWSFIRG